MALGLELAAEGLALGYGKRELDRDFSLRLSGGELHCLLGPNGVGKTTAFRTILGLLKPLSGSISIGGRDLSTFRRRELARLLAYVPQRDFPVFPFTSGEVVLMGRIARFGLLRGPGAPDRRAAALAMERLGVSGLSDRTYSSLSGGERQLVLIARAAAQEAEFLLMDEPTSSLDFQNQARVLAAIRELS